MGNAFRRLQDIMPAGMKPKIFLSLADEYPYAQAYVIVSAETV
jgi:holo-[acyl-carrier protein] synthase